MHWVDGLRTESLPLPDRGLNFGDGLFETMLFAQNHLFYRGYHLARLARGIVALGFSDCLTLVNEYLSAVVEELKLSAHRQYSVRLTLTRGDGPRGYAPGTNSRPRVIVSATHLVQDWQQRQSAAAIGVAKIRWSCQPQLAGLKHLNRLEQVLAARERVDQGLDELIMLDEQARVISTISGNIFAVIDDALITPKLHKCGIEGTRRQLIIEGWSKKIGIDTRESMFDVEQLHQSAEVFFCNSLIGLRPVASLGSKTWSRHPVCQALHAVYCGENQ
ncbi:MAG: aminodeoxychorismate lyase [Halioglobus sp.]